MTIEERIGERFKKLAVSILSAPLRVAKEKPGKKENASGGTN